MSKITDHANHGATRQHFECSGHNAFHHHSQALLGYLILLLWCTCSVKNESQILKSFRRICSSQDLTPVTCQAVTVSQTEANLLYYIASLSYQDTTLNPQAESVSWQLQTALQISVCRSFAFDRTSKLLSCSLVTAFVHSVPSPEKTIYLYSCLVCTTVNSVKHVMTSI
jgi:hypothetical protein